MKYRVTPATFHCWLPVLLRQEFTAAGAPGRCPIRKCRRDRSCTGPLLRHRDGVTILLAEAEAGRAAARLDEGDAVAPLCISAFAEDLVDAVGAAARERGFALVAPPGGTVIEPTRALAARRWRECRIEDEPLGAKAGADGTAA